MQAEFKTFEAEFKEFEPRLKFKPRLKYGWFHLKLYSIFHELSLRSIETGSWQIEAAAQNWDTHFGNSETSSFRC